MKIIPHILPEKHNIYLFGDMHEGTIFQDANALKKAIDKIGKDPIGYAAVMGDLCEARTVDHPFYRPQADRQIILPAEQYTSIIAKLEPIKRKLLVLLEGNHDIGLSRYGNFVGMAATKLEVPFGTYSCVVHVKMKKRFEYKMFLTHGRKGISSTSPDPNQRLANMQRQLRDRLKWKMGDCIVMARGHTHRLLLAPPVDELFLYTEEKKVESKYRALSKTIGYIDPAQRWYVNTGGFIRNYVDNVTSYGETLDLDPLEIGMAVVKVKEQQIEVELVRLA